LIFYQMMEQLERLPIAKNKMKKEKINFAERSDQYEDESGPSVLESLTPRQMRFAEEYLIDLNATQAAIRAGYSKKHADRQGSRLVGKSRVRLQIQPLMDDRSFRTGVLADDRIRTLSRIASKNLTDFVIYSSAGFELKSDALANPDLAIAVKNLELMPGGGRIEMQDKVAALGFLLAHLNMRRPGF